MDWQKISIERLKDYTAREQSLMLIPEQIQALEMSFVSLRAARTDSTPVVEGRGNKREDALISNIVSRQELERNLAIAEKELSITNAGLAALTDEEKRILYKFYINRSRGYVEDLCEELGYERTQVYAHKDKALRKFTLACYGIVEL